MREAAGGNQRKIETGQRRAERVKQAELKQHENKVPNSRKETETRNKKKGQTVRRRLFLKQIKLERSQVVQAQLLRGRRKEEKRKKQT